jgi:hypothetical protein
MRPSWEYIAHVCNIALLRVASLLVPRSQRAEWWHEWHSELWHVRHACAPMGSFSLRGEAEVIAFCLGAFQDAGYLKRHRFESGARSSTLQGSAAQCILLLAAMLAASYSLALLLPGVRAERSLAPIQIGPSLVLIQDIASSDASSPSILPKQFRTWKERKQQYFDGFAFYRVTQEPVQRESASTASGEEAGWGVAHASENIFALLGLPVQFSETDAGTYGNIPRVILSERKWKREFQANPRVAGMVLHLGSGKARIVGVAPDGSRGLPGNVDAWLLEPDEKTFAGGAGFVIAHLTAMGKSEMYAAKVRITEHNSDYSEDDLLGISLDALTPGSWALFSFALFLAILALPAITSVSLGEYSGSSERTSRLRTLYRWLFLSTKIALLLPIVYFSSLDLAYANTALPVSSSEYVQLVSTFSICLFGFRWVLQDQRQRCPVCLRRVCNPAHVGQASRTFLAWNGTELMCMGGHTLLHVPGLPTSWFSTQRWLYLDSSWGFLFAAPGPTIRSETISGL